MFSFWFDEKYGNVQLTGDFVHAAGDDDCDGDQFGRRENILYFGCQFDTETVDERY